MSAMKATTPELLAPGIYLGMTAETYFADPCPNPSLTQSIAKVLLEQSPAHARLQHPRLAPPLRDEDETEKYDSAKAIGDAAHAMMIGRGKMIAEAQFKNFQTKDAKAFRDDPANAGKVVILSRHLRRAAAMVNTAREALKAIGWNAFSEGDGEVVIAWTEDGLWFRSMIDWKEPSPICDDYKTTGMSIAPHGIGRLIEAAGWHIQAAMQERGLCELEGGRRNRFRFLAQENYPPYAVVPVELDVDWLEMGHRQLNAAIDIWQRCMETDVWPAYPLIPTTPEYPSWKEAQWLNREIHEAAASRSPQQERVPQKAISYVDALRAG